jgi:SSS family solute:Na+ symporter
VISEVTTGAFAGQGWFADAGHGVPRWLASAVICAVVLAYVFMGGMRGTAWANALQTTIFMVLGIVTFITIAFALGKSETLLGSMQAASATVPESHVTREKIPVATWFSFLLIPLSVGMFPHIFQHWLTARSATAFRLPIIMHPVFVMLVWAPCVMIGVWAAGSGIAFDGENVVLGRMVQQLASPLMAGLLTAGVLAAIMSSLDSQFLCVGTMFSEDVVRGSAETRLTDSWLVGITRLFVVIVVAATYMLSLYLPQSVFDLGVWSFSGFTGLFPLVFSAIYWRRLTAAGAIASVLVTAVSWTWLFARSEWGANKRYAFPEQPVSLGWIEIPPMLPIVTICAASALALVIVSLATRPPKAETIEKFFQERSRGQVERGRGQVNRR